MGSKMEREARNVLRILNEAGYEAYFVGGCVRDRLLGFKIKDMDIATAALPEQVMSLFPRTAPTGLQHGTVTVIMNDHTFEVTTFRTEAGYEDYRRPTEVMFVSSLEEDLRRRDFTMNAMAMGEDGAVFDPFGGQADLRRAVLRCVGEAEQRFGEDALRMMRCIRFAAAYTLEIEEATWSALLQQRSLLRHIAMERNRAELERMVEGRAPLRSLQLLAVSELWRHFKTPTGLDWGYLPGLNADEASRRSLSGAWSRVESPEVRWAVLFLLLGASASDAADAMQALVFAKKRLHEIRQLLECDEWLREQASQAGADMCITWKLAALRFGRSTAERWLELRSVVHPQVSASLGAALERCIKNGRAWLNELSVGTLAELAVTGADVMKSLRAKGGPWLGTMLQMLLQRTALGQLPNERDILLAEASKLYSELNS